MSTFDQTGRFFTRRIGLALLTSLFEAAPLTKECQKNTFGLGKKLKRILIRETGPKRSARREVHRYRVISGSSGTPLGESECQAKTH
jgi:hypothetical protein